MLKEAIVQALFETYLDYYNSLKGESKVHTDTLLHIIIQDISDLLGHSQQTTM